MASTATDFLIGKAERILENEASTTMGIRDQLDEIKLELVWMKSFLQDAEGNKACTKGEETWVASVRDSVYDVEDIIDEYMYHRYEQRSGTRLAKLLRKTIHIPKNWYKSRFVRWLHKTTANPKRKLYRGRFARWLNKILHVPQYLWYRHKIGKKLQKVAKTIKDIPERKQRYSGLMEGARTSQNVHQAESSLFVREDELVGIEGKKQILMGWLMSEAQHRIIVTVVGMGGSGKTTLVAKTFTNETVKKHFDCYAWITVSQTHLTEDLFKNLIKEFQRREEINVIGDLNEMSYRDLLEMLVTYLRECIPCTIKITDSALALSVHTILSAYLKSRRYLVVLDDVWDIKLWEKIRLSFPDTQLGSRIILTTQKENIASYPFGVESHVHRVQPLEKNDSWDLFRSKAFSTYHNKCCPSELKPLALRLVGKCEGLPLAIVALGGVMSGKKSCSEWEKVYNSLDWHLANNSLLETVKSILLVSFNDLPYRLKHCFLHCSLFPEDYLIRTERLIRLWIAEGFVEHVKGFTPEDVAESYLMELNFRSMLQVVRCPTMRKACKMHDLMRELALSIAEKEKFCAVYDGREVMDEIGARRLSIQTTEGEIKSCKGMSQLRSFHVFVTDIFSQSFSNTLVSGFKLLRILDLEDVPINKLPNDLMYLFNLRYLSLSRTPIKELPKSIGILYNLQTLDISDTEIVALPREITKLKNLRHLIMYRYTGDSWEFTYAKGIIAPSAICKLKKLQVLSFVQSEGDIIRLVGNMTQLTHLGITNVYGGDEMTLCASIGKMKLLRYLYLLVTDEKECLRIDALDSPPIHLQRLLLSGKLEKVPRWLCSLKSLTDISLRWSRLEEDLLPHIEALPFLERVILVNAYVGKELCFTTGFQKLTHLELLNFPSLNKITIEEGVMPNLQILVIHCCMELRALPCGVEYLTSLETLRLGSLPMKLIESIQEGGVDHPKVQHIPIIDYIFEA